MKKIVALIFTALVVGLITLQASAAPTGKLSLRDNLPGGCLLTPGEEYRFELLVDGHPVTDALLKDYNIRISAGEGSETLTFFGLVKIEDQHMLKVRVKAAWPIRTAQVSYEMRLIVRKTGATRDTLTLRFETGYREADDSLIADLQMGDEVLIDPARPLFASHQLERLATRNRDRPVTFVGDRFRFAVRVTDMQGVNLLYNQNGIPELLGRYPDNDFAFINFPAGSRFLSLGTFVYDVSQLVQSPEHPLFVYRYTSGRPSPIPAIFDADAQTLTFKTDTLGRFVITDKPLSAADASAQSSGPPVVEGSSDRGKTNPDTGVHI